MRPPKNETVRLDSIGVFLVVLYLLVSRRAMYVPMYVAANKKAFVSLEAVSRKKVHESTGMNLYAVYVQKHSRIQYDRHFSKVLSIPQYTIDNTNINPFLLAIAENTLNSTL